MFKKIRNLFCKPQQEVNYRKRIDKDKDRYGYINGNFGSGIVYYNDVKEVRVCDTFSGYWVIEIHYFSRPKQRWYKGMAYSGDLHDERKQLMHTICQFQES